MKNGVFHRLETAFFNWRHAMLCSCPGSQSASLISHPAASSSRTARASPGEHTREHIEANQSTSQSSLTQLRLPQVNQSINQSINDGAQRFRASHPHPHPQSTNQPINRSSSSSRSPSPRLPGPAGNSPWMRQPAQEDIRPQADYFGEEDSKTRLTPKVKDFLNTAVEHLFAFLPRKKVVLYMYLR